MFCPTQNNKRQSKKKKECLVLNYFQDERFLLVSSIMTLILPELGCANRENTRFNAIDSFSTPELLHSNKAKVALYCYKCLNLRETKKKTYQLIKSTLLPYFFVINTAFKLAKLLLNLLNQSSESLFSYDRI